MLDGETPQETWTGPDNRPFLTFMLHIWKYENAEKCKVCPKILQSLTRLRLIIVSFSTPKLFPWAMFCACLRSDISKIVVLHRPRCGHSFKVRNRKVRAHESKFAGCVTSQSLYTCFDWKSQFIACQNLLQAVSEGWL